SPDLPKYEATRTKPHWQPFSIVATLCRESTSPVLLRVQMLIAASDFCFSFCMLDPVNTAS
ncbi:MAG: hypothetical protein ACPHJ3_07130, partial [Rubripirellula sp.]